MTSGMKYCTQEESATNTIVFDVFGWVLIKHPWSLSFKEFYVDYQPWITLIYIAIFAGPLVGYWFALI